MGAFLRHSDAGRNARVTLLPELDDLDQVSVRVAAVAVLDGGRLRDEPRLEAHAGRGEPGVLLLDVLHLDAEVGDSEIGVRAPGDVGPRDRLLVLEDLEAMRAVRDHHDAPLALAYGVRLAKPRVALVPGEVELDLEAEQVPVEADQPIEVGGRERGVVDADDHHVPPAWDG